MASNMSTPCHTSSPTAHNNNNHSSPRSHTFNNSNQHHNNLSQQSVRNNRGNLAAQTRQYAGGNHQIPFQAQQQQHRFQNNHQMHHPILPRPVVHPHQNMAMGFMRPEIHGDGADLPLRILVQSDMVGAIIGRSGSTIRQVTQQTRARIDVHREDSNQQDKVITINGSPESCSEACFKIIEIILNERSQLNKSSSSNSLDNQSGSKQHLDNPDSNPEIQLKMLAHNNLIGRLIGKRGASIKEIMEQTSTKINISTNSLTDSTQEHTITVVGNLDNVRHAENLISSKLKAAYMADVNSTMQTMNQQPYLFNNVPIPYMPGSYPQNPILSSLVGSQTATSGGAISRGVPVGPHQGSLYSAPSNYMPLYPNVPVQAGLLGYNPVIPGGEHEKETVNIYIPNTMVGAIIGKSGSAIKEMISTSGASIKVATAPAPSAENSTNINNNNNIIINNNNDSSHKSEESSSSQATKSELTEDSNPVENSKNSTDDPQSDPPTTVPSETDTNPPATTTTTSSTSNTTDTNTTSTATSNASSSTPKMVANSDYNSTTRRVTIIGTPESQRTAQYMIYRKISIENGKSDTSLTVELQVPSQFVGKIIGKGGSTVRQLQMQTRTTIRLPDEKPNSSGNDSGVASETYVQISGEFQGSQIAQRHIRNLIREGLYSASRHAKHHQNKLNENNNSGKANAQPNQEENNRSDRCEDGNLDDESSKSTENDADE